MSIFNNVQDNIDDGRAGNTLWIPIGFPKIGEHVGIIPKTYTLLGGNSGTGKTSYCDLSYVLNPYQWIQENGEDKDVKFTVLYKSMERPKEYKIAKWICMKLWQDHQIMCDVPTLFRWGEHRSRIPDDVYALITGYRKYFEKMEDTVIINDGPENPTGIYRWMVNKIMDNGTYVTSDDKVIKIYRQGKSPFKGDCETIRFGTAKTIEITIYGEKVQVHKMFAKFFLIDKRHVYLCAIDHMGKCTHEQGLDDRGTLNKMTEYASGKLRDVFGASIVAVSQFNRATSDSQRRFSKEVEMAPMETDFKGSGNMFNDSDAAIALFNPWRYGMVKYLDYEVDSFVNAKGYNRFRSLHVLKNSYGVDDVAYGLHFLGEIGGFAELPAPHTIKDYKQYANPKFKQRLC
jgi:hypothetical protein